MLEEANPIMGGLLNLHPLPPGWELSYQPLS